MKNKRYWAIVDKKTLEIKLSGFEPDTFPEIWVTRQRARNVKNADYDSDCIVKRVKVEVCK